MLGPCLAPKLIKIDPFCDNSFWPSWATRVYKIAQPYPSGLIGFAGGHMGLRKTTDRNRQIFASFKAGQTVESLGEQYGLSAPRVRALLTDEKHKHEVSPECF
jgi:hypothetical protein